MNNKEGPKRLKTPLPLIYQTVLLKLKDDSQCPDFCHALFKILTPSTIVHIMHSCSTCFDNIERKAYHILHHLTNLLMIQYKTSPANLDPYDLPYLCISQTFMDGHGIGIFISKQGMVYMTKLIPNTTDLSYHIDSNALETQTNCPIDLTQDMLISSFDLYMMHIVPVVEWMEQCINHFLKKHYGETWFKKYMTTHGINL